MWMLRAWARIESKYIYVDYILGDMYILEVNLSIHPV